MPGLKGLRDGVFCDQILFHRKSKFSMGNHLNIWKYNVNSTKLLTKVKRLHKIWVEKISSLHLNKFAVHDCYVFSSIS